MLASKLALALLVLVPLQTKPAAPAAGAAAQATLPAGTWTELDAAARALAKGGRELEYKRLVALCRELGMPEAALAKLEKGALSELRKASKAADAVPDAARRLKAVARQIAPLLPKLEEEERARLARLVLELDESVDEAHQALGEERVGTQWMSAEEQKTRERRGRIVEAVAKAGTLTVEIESGESQDELLAAIQGKPGSFARYGAWTLQSSLSAERTRRILLEVLRAEALSAWLRGKELAVPKKPPPTQGRIFYLLDQQQKHRKAVDLQRAAGLLDDKQAEEVRELGGFIDRNGTYFTWDAFESALETNLFCQLNGAYDAPNTTAVRAGHLNWVSLTLFGVSIPQYTWRNKSSGAPQSETHVDNPAERRLREEKLQLAKAGILGCRTWMAYLAERNEDPKWENSFVDELGKVTGEDLLKATMVAEYMQELDILRKVLQSLYTAQQGEKTYAAMNKALGQPVTEFEARWRAWIVPHKGGIAQAVDKQSAAGLPADALAALAHLNQIRRSAFEGRVEKVPELKLEREICDAAQKHAEYLVQNPEQADKWPDAHEEYRDKPGYTPEGHWSGNHSNVVSGLDDAKEAIDGWIGTFYHRLPMLTPELVRIGWGQAGQMAVLDVSSFVTPPATSWVVVFPYDGMSDVPPHFVGIEHPNPVPEEPDEDFGYPITLQIGLPAADAPVPEITLRLLEGKSEVPCWFSSPSKPTNPDLVPRNAWCLIPKGALKASTGYSVQAEWYGTGQKLEWSFRTGGK